MLQNLLKGLSISLIFVALAYLFIVPSAKVSFFLHTQFIDDERLALSIRPSKLSIDEKSEKEMFELVNKERLKAKLPPLIWDEGLRDVARKHSQDMWEKKYFAHMNPLGESPFDRMEKGGVEFRRAGENLALSRNVERAHQGLMESEGHRKNILDHAFGRIGIGVIDGGIYGKIFTQNFAD